MKPIYRVLIVVAVVGAGFVWSQYDRKRFKDSTRAQVMAACDADAACQSAVTQHFDTCFEVGTRSKPGSDNIDMPVFAECINLRAGQPFLEAKSKR